MKITTTALVALTTFSLGMESAQADWKSWSGNMCRPQTATVLYGDDGMTVLQAGSVVCPILRDNSTGDLAGLTINLYRYTAAQMTCYLYSIDDKTYSIVMGTWAKANSSGYVDLAVPVHDPGSDYDYGSWVIKCSAQTGDRFRNLRWSE